MTVNSRWDLEDAEVSKYLDRSFDFIIDFLRRIDESEPYRLDPSGDAPLRMAKRVRRTVLRAGHEGELQTRAERHFGLPESKLAFAKGLRQPLYVAARSASS
jgi:hypothetical protein